MRSIWRSSARSSFGWHLDVLPRVGQLALERLHGLAGDVWIGAPMDDRHAHLDVVRHTDDTGHPLGILFGPAPLAIAADESRQRHEPLLHGDRDVRRIMSGSQRSSSSTSRLMSSSNRMTAPPAPITRKQ
jgi:hypothetical protein